MLEELLLVVSSILSIHPTAKTRCRTASADCRPGVVLVAEEYPLAIPATDAKLETTKRNAT